MHLIFMIFHIIVGVVFLKYGIEPYWQGGGPWDAGVLPLFIAFWFFFAALGFYRKNIWLVSMSNLALAGLLALYLFIDLLEYVQTGFRLSSAEARIIVGCFAAGIFLIAGEIYAIWRFRRVGDNVR
jgi:hypothetical protein